MKPRAPIGNRLRPALRGEADFTSEPRFDHERTFGLPVATPAYWPDIPDEPPPADTEPTWKSALSLVLIIVTAYAVWVVLAAVLQ